MSYILDALRKADAERERGSVPGIHAQPLAAVLPGDAASRSGGGLADGSRRWLLAGAAAALALFLAVVLTRALLPAAADDRTVLDRSSDTAQAQAQIATPPTADALPPAVSAPADQPSAAVPIELRAAAARPGSRAAAAASSPAAATDRPAMAAPTARAPVDADTRTPPVAAPSVAASAAPPAAVGTDRIHQAGELPDDIRRQLPALTIGGATYSENAASRMLIINGQVFHERDQLTPDLVLERIQLRSAVLRYRGLRFAIAY